MDNIKQWTKITISQCVRAAEDRSRWKEIVTINMSYAGQCNPLPTHFVVNICSARGAPGTCPIGPIVNPALTMIGKGRELADMTVKRKVDNIDLDVHETRWKRSNAR